MEIKITTNDIIYAEKILFGRIGVFSFGKGDSENTRKQKRERQDFIKNLDTIDLQAVPGSGKTTVLLAKLLILERYMPFNDGSGILVISHTNTAVDEIKTKIGKYCPKLFSYPNFVGTIQSFVDQFLAIPFYLNTFNTKPYRIDDELYNEKIKKFISSSTPWFYKQGLSNNNFKKILNIKNVNPNKFYNFRFGINNNKVILKESLNGGNIDIKKPRSKVDYTMQEKKLLYNWFLKFKRNLLQKEKILHFDDAYFLANRYIQRFPQIIRLLQKRFMFVFIDEMQDMDKHQYDILEKLFFGKRTLRHCYQRIGDKNQAIFNGELKLDNIWNESKRKKMSLRGSYRLTPETAQVVKCFGLDYQEIEGLRNSYNIKPHIIVFNETKEVLPAFVKLIQENELRDNEYPFCAIGWGNKEKYYTKADATKNSKIKAGDINPNKYIIKSYHPDFNKDIHKPKIDYIYLKDYIKYYENKDNSLAPIRKNILNIFIKILRIENIKDEYNRIYTIKKFMNFLKENNENKYEDLKLKLFKWSFSTIKGEDIYNNLKIYIQPFLKEIFPDMSFSLETINFINSTESSNLATSDIDINQKKSKYFEKDNIKVNINTIHSVKGETHTATLYMECFYKKGRGNYESERLVDQLTKNIKINETIESISTSEDLIKQSAKMVYVGFSRPTHLLCFAIHKDRIDNDFNYDNWEVIRINE